VISSSTLEDGKRRFDGDQNPHHHFVCKVCHRIEDFEWKVPDILSLSNLATHAMTVDSVHLEIHGICQICQEDEQKPKQNQKGGLS